MCIEISDKTDVLYTRTKVNRRAPSICCSREVRLQTPFGIRWTCPNFFQDLTYFLSVACTKIDQKLSLRQTCDGMLGSCGDKVNHDLYFIYLFFAWSWRVSISDKSLNLKIGESGENQIPLENYNPPPPTDTSR